MCLLQSSSSCECPALHPAIPSEPGHIYGKQEIVVISLSWTPFCLVAKGTETYINLGLRLVVVGLNAGDLRGQIHFILQLGNFVGQLF